MPFFSLLRVVQVGFKSLRLHKLRSSLTMLGMVIGVWAVITLVAIGEGASQDAQEAIKRLGAQNVIIRSVKPLSDKTQLQGRGMEWETIYGLKNADAARIQDTVPGVKRVLPILSQRKNVKHGRREVDCQLIGTYPYYPDFTQSKIVAGQFLNEAEENSKAASCVITLELAERLFAGHNPLMEKVIVRGFESSQVFQVKGILQERVDTEKLPRKPMRWGAQFPPMYIFRCLPLSHFMESKTLIAVWAAFLWSAWN